MEKDTLRNRTVRFWAPSVMVCEVLIVSLLYGVGTGNILGQYEVSGMWILAGGLIFPAIFWWGLGRYFSLTDKGLDRSPKQRAALVITLAGAMGVPLMFLMGPIAGVLVDMACCTATFIVVCLIDWSSEWFLRWRARNMHK